MLSKSEPVLTSYLAVSSREVELQSHLEYYFFHISQHLNRVSLHDISKAKTWQSRLVQAFRSLIRRNSTGVSGVNVCHKAPLLARRLIPVPKRIGARSSDRVDGGAQILQLICPPLTNPISKWLKRNVF